MTENFETFREELKKSMATMGRNNAEPNDYDVLLLLLENESVQLLVQEAKLNAGTLRSIFCREAERELSGDETGDNLKTQIKRSAMDLASLADTDFFTHLAERWDNACVTVPDNNPNEISVNLFLSLVDGHASHGIDKKIHKSLQDADERLRSGTSIQAQPDEEVQQPKLLPGSIMIDTGWHKG